MITNKPRNEEGDRIFDGSYKSEEKPLWKNKRIIYTIIFSCFIALGLQKIVYENKTKIDIKTIKGNLVNTINYKLNTTEEIFMNYEIINMSPYNVMLNIETNDIQDVYFKTNYNGEILRSKQNYWIWFKLINYGEYKNIKIEIKGELI